jgi:hypothetical protein
MGAVMKTDEFRAAYHAALMEQYNKHPEEYAYPAELIPSVVDKMMRAFAAGSASIGPAAKKAARVVGIKPTIKAIKEFLAS